MKKIIQDKIRLLKNISKTKKRYTMDELLALSDYSQPQSLEGREWVDAPAVGNERLC